MVFRTDFTPAHCPIFRCCGVLALFCLLLVAFARLSPLATASTDSWEVHIALLSDPHVADDSIHAPYVARFRDVVREVNSGQFDAVVIAGDLTEGGHAGDLRLVRTIAGDLHLRPMIVAGNHDVGAIASGDKAGPSGERLNRYAQIIGPHFSTTDLPHGLKLVGIDSSLLGSGNELEAQQWKLLEQELGPDVPARSRLVVMHYPPFVNAPDEPDDYFNIPHAARTRFLKLLDGGRAAAVLTGHLHRPNDRTYAGTRIITTPPLSFGLPHGKQPPGWTSIEVRQDRSIGVTVHTMEEAEKPDTRVHIFYYPWYGAPPVDSSFMHWTQGGNKPPESIGAAYYPVLGAYSSGDPKVIKQHMSWIRQARTGVLVVSWWGRDSIEDRRAKALLEAAAEAGLRVTFHIEPYHGQTPASVAADIAYLLKQYGKHPAFYREPSLDNKPLFYVFEALRHPAAEWQAAIRQARSTAGPFAILAQTSNLAFIEAGDFDGGYTYDVLPAFKDETSLRRWKESLVPSFKKAGKLFVPSVGPGFDDRRAVPGSTAKVPDQAESRNGGKGTSYDAQWQAAIDAQVPFVSVTSFNEWHEGTQIEPAVRKETPDYTYPAYDGGKMQYIERTAAWVGRFSKDAPPADAETRAATQAATQASHHHSTKSEYLKPDAIDWRQVLAGPPAKGSAQEQQEVQELLKLQAARTAAQIKQCKVDQAFSPFTFSEVLGSGFNPDDLPVTASFLKQTLHDADQFSEGAKRDFGRQRPYLVDARIEPCINRVKTNSYPSGHALRSTVLSLVIAEIYPDRRDALLAIAKRVGESRAIGGVHFPSDIEAGQTLGRAIFDKLREAPAFQAALEKARAECRAASAPGGQPNESPPPVINSYKDKSRATTRPSAAAQ